MRREHGHWPTSQNDVRRSAMKSSGQLHTGWMKSQPMSHTFSLVLQATALLLSQMAATDSANYILNQNSTTRFIYEQASKVTRPRFKKSSFWGPVNGIYCIGSGTRLHLPQNRKYERVYINLSSVLSSLHPIFNIKRMRFRPVLIFSFTKWIATSLFRSSKKASHDPADTLSRWLAASLVK